MSSDSSNKISRRSVYSFHNSISSLNSEKGIVLINSNGQYYHAVSAYYINKLEANKLNNNYVGVNFELDDEDLQNNGRVEELIYSYKRTVLLLTFILIVGLAFDIIDLLLSYRDKNKITTAMSMLYSQLDQKQLNLFYWIITLFEYIFCIIFYPLGFYVCYKKNLNYIDFFNLLALIGMLVQMMQAYIQNFNAIIFAGRCVVFVVSKNQYENLLKIMYLMIHF